MWLFFAVGFIFTSVTTLAWSAYHREILQRLFNSRRREEKRKEYLLFRLLYQFVSSLLVSTWLSSSLAGSKNSSTLIFNHYIHIYIRICMSIDRFQFCVWCVQIRRYVYHDVIRLDDATNLVDCAYIQVTITKHLLFSIWKGYM